MSQQPEESAYNQLSPRRQRFVDEYVVDFNGTQAAIRAGYAPKAANEQAARLLANASVKAAVEERRKSIRKRTVDYRQYLIKKSRKIIDKCTDEKWNPQGANGAIRNMVDILGLKTEKHEISGPNGTPIQIEYDYSKLSTEEIKQLIDLATKAGVKK